MSTATATDRVYPATRALAIVIIPFLLVAFYILYFRTAETGELFAWKIAAPMTAMMLGSAYLGGAYFFLRVALAQRWHHVGVGFIPVATFASFMGVATLLHWSKFNQGHISFIAWFVLYFTTPFLVLVTWLWNHRVDDGALDEKDFLFSTATQYVAGGVGVFYILTAILLMVVPQVMLGIWPWELTLLTARVVGGMLALFGVFVLTVAIDRRWSSCRVPLQSLVLTMLLGLVALLRTWSTYDTTRWFTWVFVLTLVAVIVVVPIFYWRVESRLKAR